MRRLNNKVKEQTVIAAFKATVIPVLETLYQEMCAGITGLAREMFKDFDFKGAEKFREYMDWHDYIYIDYGEANTELSVRWANSFMQVFGLEGTRCVSLVDFEYPSRLGTAGLDSKFKKRVIGIVKPYVYKLRETEEMWNSINTLLKGVSTFKDLEESLPSLLPYLPQDGAAPVTALVPAEQYDKINRFFQVFKSREEVAGE